MPLFNQRKCKMSNIPDFVAQVQDVENKLSAEWQSVQEGWQDSVAAGFNESVMIPYFNNFQQYITGQGLNGLGIEQLLLQMDKHLQDMEPLTV